MFAEFAEASSSYATSTSRRRARVTAARMNLGRPIL